MANRNFKVVKAPESEIILVMGSFVTAGTGAPTGVSGQLASVARDSAGQFSVTLTDKYFQYMDGSVNIVGTAGTQGFVEAHDLPAKDVTVQLRDTDGAVGDTTGETVHVRIWARNSKLTRR